MTNLWNKLKSFFSTPAPKHKVGDEFFLGGIKCMWVDKNYKPPMFTSLPAQQTQETLLTPEALFLEWAKKKREADE